MKAAVLGTGVVGTTVAAKLVQLGHDVMIGSRTRDNEKARQWASANGERATHGTFADAASFAEIVFNCTNGMGSLDALAAAGAGNLKGKILVDIANPLDASGGMPPKLSVCNTDSLGEQIQKAFPDTKVVKTLNTVNAKVMVEPSLVPGEHNIFVCGDDAGAKARVTDLLVDFGWKRDNIIDLGGIGSSRNTEMLVPMWVNLMMKFQTPNFNFRVVR